VYNHFTVVKVGGACSHLGAIDPKVGGALVVRTTKFLQGLKFIVWLSICYLSKLDIISKNGIC